MQVVFFLKINKIMLSFVGKLSELSIDSLVKEAETLFYASQYSKSIELYEICIEKMNAKGNQLSNLGRIYLNLIYLCNVAGKMEKAIFYANKLTSELQNEVN